MAISVAANDVAGVLAKAGADLRFLFDRKGVDTDFAIKLYSVGITTVELFAVFAKDQSDLEDTLKLNFEIDTADILSRVKISKIVVAWQAARTRAQKQTEQDGDCEVRRVPKDVPLSSVAAMNSAFELAHWPLEDKQKPARSYLERKLDEIEKDDLRAEPLEEVVSVEEDDPDMLRTEWKPDGQLRAVRIGTKVSLPKGPEDLRKRLARLGTTLLFAGYQQVHKTYLKGLTPQVFVDDVEYLLGDYVWKLASRGVGGGHRVHPIVGLAVVVRARHQEEDGAAREQGPDGEGEPQAGHGGSGDKGEVLHHPALRRSSLGETAGPLRLGLRRRRGIKPGPAQQGEQGLRKRRKG